MGSDHKEILCLCQDELTLQVRRLLFEHFGYRVLAADSVHQMHTMLREACPDMLLLDTSDPTLDYEEITEEAKTICPDILSVVLTADYGVHGNGSGPVDRFLRMNGPREEWISGIQSLLLKHSKEGTEESPSLS